MPFLSNIGPGELILILIIALVVFGPGKLPEVGQAVGRGIREFRRAASDVTEATRIDAPSATDATAPVAPPAASSAATPPAAVPPVTGDAPTSAPSAAGDADHPAA